MLCVVPRDHIDIIYKNINDTGTLDSFVRQAWNKLLWCFLSNVPHFYGKSDAILGKMTQSKNFSALQYGTLSGSAVHTEGCCANQCRSGVFVCVCVCVCVYTSLDGENARSRLAVTPEADTRQSSSLRETV